MSKMTQQQMALALSELGDFSIMIRSAGDWYASVEAEIKTGSMLSSPTVSEPTPGRAIRALFEIYSLEGARVVLSAFRDCRRVVTWNGFMWREVS